MEASTGQPLRPLTFGEVLGAGFALATRNAGPLVAAVAVVIVPAQILAVLVQGLLGPETFQISLTPREPSAGALIGQSIAQVISVLASTVASAACLKAVSEAYVGGRPDWRESVGLAFRRLGSLLWVSILSTLPIIGLFLLFLIGALIGVPVLVLVLLVLLLIVPLIYVYVSWVFAVPALLLEDFRGTRALGRSFALIRERWWFTFGVIVILALVIVGLALLVGLVLGVLAFLARDALVIVAILSLFIAVLVALLTTPLAAAFVMVLYFDVRVRKEGLDLPTVAHQVGVSVEQARGGSPYIKPPPVWAQQGYGGQPSGDPTGMGPSGWSPPGGSDAAERPPDEPPRGSGA